jgi:hypothetical protein
MNGKYDFEGCVLVLTGEIELLKKISEAQGKVRQSVMSRDWADFDEKNSVLNLLGEEFARLEAERERLFPAGEGKSFYDAITDLPAEESRELSRLYRELKMETLKMRALNETFLAYLNEAKALAAAYIETVCPGRGGKLYTSNGRRVSQDLKSIVVNNRF